MALPNLLAVLAVLLWAAYELILRRREEAGTASWQAGAGDRGSTRLLLGSYLVAVVVVAGLSAASVALLPVAWRWAGVVLAVAGLAVRAWGMRTLGRYYTRTLRTDEGQRLVQEGPYRLVRHPGYCGSLLVWAGYALTVGGWLAFVLVTGLLLVAYGWRIRAEEELLLASFGEEYADYRRRTKRLVPYVY
ncbi:MULTISPECIES: isoprenylcysteine carboxylmethyltransferase family protein [Streptomyces]|uniref:Isoprenylcysteine carboxylmethyltransferase family protein n=1 Tax=Streptomyces luteosporeus TaxID=173856 RepID=A0ABP6G7E7_9ACTN